MNSERFESERKEVYEKLTVEAAERLLEIYNALWIYDFDKVLEIADYALKSIDKELQKTGLTSKTLVEKARSLKQKVKKEAPGHEITVLAPIIVRLTRIRDQATQIQQAQRIGIIKPPKRLRYCRLLSTGEIYLARCLLPGSLKIEDQSTIKTVFMQLNPLDLEVYTIGASMEARIWLQNMIIDVTLIENKLEIRVLASPKARENAEIIESIIDKIFSNLNNVMV
ncbi:hypothetical protein PYJP_07810 [Pyrofollis japonicus]|uniref:hypothetical protein n=1 Tax=Pyrofollis japonicus TaxID=3060460 RepID=UPI00295C0618|nr:hypothetical protein [Pyrofollis japonicus]BEP17429.1 hypothetical protein PYJP_07810 [Pyrofollis japonicus]